MDAERSLTLRQAELPAPSESMAPDAAVERIPLGLRWFNDGFSVVPHPQGLVTRLCDMSQGKRTIEALRARGVRATPTHLFVRAAALALARNPAAHESVCGYQRIRPSQVDVGLSVAGQTNYAPVLVLRGAERLALPELVREVTTGAEATRRKEEVDLVNMRRTGWIIPFGALRRFIMRRLYRSFWFRRRLVGTFQITCLSDVDQFYALVFYSGCALGVGRVTDRVLAVDGAPVVRPTAWLTLAFDHKALDGRRVGALLSGICEILESEELLREALAAPRGTQGPSDQDR